MSRNDPMKAYRRRLKSSKKKTPDSRNDANAASSFEEGANEYGYNNEETRETSPVRARDSAFYKLLGNFKQTLIHRAELIKLLRLTANNFSD